jgi:ATP-binding cassette subfamily E protein 1
MRIAVIDKDKCKPKNCFLCIKFCPEVRMGSEAVFEGEDGYPVISEELCTGCGICTKKCPFGAIYIINLPEELGEPVHRYGVNAFRVFGLPVPKENSVVGIIGSNGIGKTTVMKILTGNLKPNMGHYEGEAPSWGEIVERHRGREIQNYLEKLAEGAVKVSLKPQNVDRIPEKFKGTVRELLEKMGGGTGGTGDIGELLEIGHIMERKLDEISGGELQRVAIAVALTRKADIYCFDEPSSYLDIRQRLKMAKIIRKLAEDNSVIVIEHDLAVLDYLSDYAHVMYGKPGAYGIVSGLKGSRVGINEFLGGYLRAENVRFRKQGIKFEVKAPSDAWEGKTRYKFDSFTKEYGNFRLDVAGGGLRKGEVVGILGPNAIGKSTLMRVLAGEEKPSEGKLGWKLKISYKPQYIQTDFPGTVQDLVINTKGLDKELFNSQLKDKVQDLYEKEIPKLSGGELQRVSVALAMAKECDLCLLDEPSAFLDVEQRVEFADVIRRVTEKKEITTLVVDHDITMQDYVSDRLMVFDGEPGKRGRANAPESLRSGMNRFLKGMDITFRRDKETGRPRANKPGSQKDAEQKRKGEYYYAVVE